MTLTIELPKEDEAAWKEEAERQGMTPEGLTRQAMMKTLIAGLKDRRSRKRWTEIKPRRLPPPGKTAMR